MNELLRTSKLQEKDNEKKKIVNSQTYKRISFNPPPPSNNNNINPKNMH